MFVSLVYFVAKSSHRRWWTYVAWNYTVIKVEIFGTIANKPVLHYAVFEGNLNFKNAVLIIQNAYMQRVRHSEVWGDTK